MSAPSDERSIAGMLRDLLRVMDARRKRHLAGLLVLLLVSAIAEMITLGAIVPFVGVLVEPELAFRSAIVARTAAWFGITDPADMLKPMTLAFGAAAVFAGAIRIVLARANATLAYGIGADLGLEVFRRTLHQPYAIHVQRNSAEVIGSVTRKVDGVVRGVLVATLNMISSATLFLVALAVLLTIDPVATGIAAVVFGSLYAIITLMMRRRLRRYGRTISRNEGQVFKALKEGLGGIREVKLYGQQDFYTRLYRSADLPLRQAQANSLFISQFPRYALEAVAIVLVAILALILVSGTDRPETVLPTLAALALGGQRMLPALQMVYAGWSTLTNAKSILADILDLLAVDSIRTASHEKRPLAFDREIGAEQVSFRYPGMTRPILDGITLRIAKGERIGLVGATGAGKSTLVDVLVGLLPPTDGAVTVDGVPLGPENLRAWQDKIAQVPQSIHLVDGSFAENIAIGETPDQIDMERVRIAARRARIADTIEARTNGYAAVVGENGVRLSGGQRQRLGIARALYRNPEVLVFDEATSALDTGTEQEVIDTLGELARDLTILMIAHRTTTLRDCDRIYRLDGGRIVWTGSYEDLTGTQS